MKCRFEIKMTNTVILTFFVFIAIYGVSIKSVSGYKVIDFDLEVAASGKHHEWKKGGEEDHYFEEHEKKGEKGEKGYKDEHE